MFLYTCVDHDRFWPVGCASVVLAETDEQAIELLDAALIERGLKPFKDKPYTLKLVSPKTPQAIILADGQY